MAITEKLAWQEQAHAREFDEMSFYPGFLMRKRFESFNEVRLLRGHAARIGQGSLHEIGCATGEFGRYVRNYLPQFSYRGFDISRPALDRAITKYGADGFVHFDGDLARLRERFGRADVVFCRDVVLHQADPYAFVERLLDLAARALVLRLRTRDAGPTVLDPEQSCQLHYDRHWVPYIVLNTGELVARIGNDRQVHEVVVSRRYEPLGGHNFRYLPKELYFTAARSAETAVLALKEAFPRSGELRVTFDDRPDGPRYALWERFLLRLLRTRAMRAHTS